MATFLDLAWVIPSAPVAASLLVWLLLASFNRTMNRLTKPVSFLIIFSAAVSTGLSLILYENHLSGEVFVRDFDLANKHFHLGVFVNSSSTLAATIFGLLMLIIMITTYYRSARKNGYVFSFGLLGILSGFLFTFALREPRFYGLF